MKLEARFTQQAVDMEIISNTDQELYIVILNSIKFSVLTWATLLIMGWLSNCLYGCLIFLLLYLPLRIFSGGLHCNSHRNCYALSVVIFTSMITAYHFIDYAPIISNDYLLWGASAVIFFMAPVQDKNKPLGEAEARHHKGIARKILVLEVLVVAALQFSLWADTNTELVFFSSVSFKLLAIQLILGAVKNKRSSLKAI